MPPLDAAVLRTADASVQWLTGPLRPLTRFGERPLFREGLYRLGIGVYAWMVPNGSWGETNIGLIQGQGQSLLVDTCWDLGYTQEMLEAAQDILRTRPIEWVVNTHADGDHCWGNQLFGDTPILATHACIAQMHHTPPRALNALKAGCHVLRHLPWAGLDCFGHYMGTMLRPYDFHDVVVTPAQSGFSGDKALQVGGREVMLMEVGPAHTDGDAMVFVPDERVLYAADVLFVGVTPVMWAGPLERLMRALRRIQELRPRIIVPGHGPLATLADVDAVLRYWEFCHEALQRRYRWGMTPFEAAWDVAHDESFTTSVFARWDSPERLVTNAYTLYRHWGARDLGPPGKLGMMNVMREQARLAFAMSTATPHVMRHRR